MRFVATLIAAVASQAVSGLLAVAYAQSATLVGATPGGVGVDASGAATYSIPIVLPPGVARLAPNLTLRYSSLGGPGLPGYGWALDGLSTIQRCGRTRAQDGIVAAQEPPILTAADRFCLDGQRLILVNGVYGGDGAEYRTEIESFSRIRSFGGDGGGPRWFEVKTKAGLTYSFGDAPTLEPVGQAAESYVSRLGGDGPITQWVLSRVIDPKQNAMRFVWAVAADGSGAPYPTQILYARGASGVFGAGVAFRYAPRYDPDSATIYRFGSPSRNGNRLESISTFVRGAAGETPVRTYRIEPESEMAPLTGRMRIAAITECVADGACLPPTRFAYLDGVPGFDARAQWAGDGSWSEAGTSGFADFDGDGHRDLWSLAGNQLIVRIALSEGRFAEGRVWATITPAAAINSFQVGLDFNGDGLPDIGYIEGDSIVVRLNTGDEDRGFQSAAIWGQVTADLSATQIARGFADVDGDGLPDLWYATNAFNTHINVQRNTRSGFGSGEILGGLIVTRGPHGPVAVDVPLKGVLDLDGDGKGEFWHVSAGQSRALAINRWKSADPTPIDSYTPLGAVSTDGAQLRLGFADVNGDGLLDVWYVRESDGALAVRLNHGRLGFAAEQTWASLPGAPPPAGLLGFTDLNADGRADLWYVSSGALYVAISHGAGLRNAEAWANELPELTPGGFGFDQFSAKGRPDFWFATASGALMVQPARGPAPDLLAKVTTGLGAVTAVGYRSMTDAEFYVKSSGASYPVIDLQVPIHVVSDTSADDGSGHIARKAYSYTGWRMALDGRGSLGFEYRWVSEPVGTGPDPLYATDVMRLRQDFPYVGQVAEAKRYLLRNGVDVLPRAGHYLKNPTIYRNRARPGPAWVAIVPVFEPGPAISETRSVLCYRRSAGNWETPVCESSAPREPGYRYHVFKSTTFEINRDPDDPNSVLSLVTSELTTDEWGNTTQATVRSAGRCTASRHVFAAPDVGAWAIGRLIRSAVRTRPSESDCSMGEGDASTRVAAFDYTPEGQVAREVVEPDDSTLCVATDYEYDAFGNTTRKTTRNCNGNGGSHPLNREAAAPNSDAYFEPRTMVTRYDAGAIVAGGQSLSWDAGRFATSASNALGHTETRDFDPRTGQIVRLTGPNGIVSSVEYDALGRKSVQRETDTAGRTFSTRYDYAFTTELESAVTAVRRQDFGTDDRALAPPSWTYFDAQGREVRRVYPNFLGDNLIEAGKLERDALGRVIRAYEPFERGRESEARYTQTDYDAFGRAWRTVAPSGESGQIVTTTAYKGRETTTTVSNAGGGAGLPAGAPQTKTSVRDEQGRVARVIDAEGKVVRYEYDALGNLVKTDAGGVVTSIEYDRRGRKTGIDEPNTGTTRYAYNALGESIREIDAKGQVVAIRYDVLGRVIERTFDGAESTTWRYDDCPFGVGRLCAVSMANAQKYVRTHRYDERGRAVGTTATFEGAGELTTSVAFDASTGRAARFTYPTGFSVAYDYTDAGALRRVRHGDTGASLWQADGVDRFGRVTASTLGNGVTTTRTFDPGDGRLLGIASGAGGSVQDLRYRYDAIGNLIERRDAAIGVATLERYAHDRLNRLVEWSVGVLGVMGGESRTASYDGLGNIAFKSDVGSYRYGAVTPSGRGLPHAVSSVTGADPLEFSYDDNGNMTAGGGRRFEYTTGNRVRAVSRGANGVEYLYGPELQRIRQVVTTPKETATTYYLHGADSLGLTYEREQKSDGTVEHRHYLSAGGDVFGLYKTFGTGSAARVNVAAAANGAQAFASSSFLDNAWRMSPRAAIDGERRGAALTREGWWNDATLYEFPDWLEVQFGAERTIDEIGIFSLQDDYQSPVEPTVDLTFSKFGLTNFHVKYWNGQSWTSVPGGQVTDNRNVWRRLRLEAPIRTSRLRIEVWDSADSTSARIVEVEAWSGGDGSAGRPSELRYLHRDALGSITAITDEQGRVVERLAFDPWGKRRYPDGRADTDGSLEGRTTDRGFTLHEHLDGVGLVHMNARLYDPLLGRFTSPDTVVDGAFDLEGFNRYSYGQNRPTAGVDPSGHSFWSSLNPFSSQNLDALFNHLDNPFSARELHILIHRDGGIQIGDQLVQRYPVVGQIAQVAVVAVVSYFSGGLAGPWAAAAIAGAAGGSTAMVTYAQGGDANDYWRAGLISAATAAAFYGVGQYTAGSDVAVRVGAHAVVGCASAAASGGECAQGALAAAIGKSVSIGLESVYGPNGANWEPHEKVIGFIATSVAGGTASSLSGGTFANGAMTAAFGYLLNHMLSVGVTGRIPFIGGGSLRFGVSYYEGSWDAGLIMEGDFRQMGAGKWLGGYRYEAGYDVGDFDTQRGNTNMRVEAAGAPYVPGGASVSWDLKTREFSGATVGVGPAVGVSVGATNSNTISVRQVWREIIQPAMDRIRSWLSQ